MIITNGKEKTAQVVRCLRLAEHVLVSDRRLLFLLLLLHRLRKCVCVYDVRETSLGLGRQFSCHTHSSHVITIKDIGLTGFYGGETLPVCPPAIHLINEGIRVEGASVCGTEGSIFALTWPSTMTMTRLSLYIFPSAFHVSWIKNSVPNECKKRGQTVVLPSTLAPVLLRRRRPVSILNEGIFRKGRKKKTHTTAG